jgi:hypothetical protein
MHKACPSVLNDTLSHDYKFNQSVFLVGNPECDDLCRRENAQAGCMQGLSRPITLSRICRTGMERCADFHRYFLTLT